LIQFENSSCKEGATIDRTAWLDLLRPINEVQRPWESKYKYSNCYFNSSVVVFKIMKLLTSGRVIPQKLNSLDVNDLKNVSIFLF
jgi:hypothetical protein